MKRTILGGFFLLSAAVGCAQPGADGQHVALPGDRDDHVASGGKEDVWDSVNDPSSLAQQLEYRLSEMPREGKLDKPVWADRVPVLAGDEPGWADTYWPTASGSTNVRWQGHSVQSPLEKYDAVFNEAPGCEQPTTRCGEGAKAAWDAYFACAGPAARWQAEVFQGGNQMYDGVDNDNDGEVDECGDHDGIEGWWGLCHAWTPSALLEPEPKHTVTYQGVEFTVGDIKALIQTTYDDSEALMLGGRCHAKSIEHSATGSDANEECMDVNPGSLHVILGNFLGLHDMPLIEDRTASFEVWNQPLVGYRVSKQDKVNAARAMACIGRTGDSYTPNTGAAELYEVEVQTDYIYEGSASTRPLGMSNNIGHDDYHYILEVDDRGKIVGGTYCSDSESRHPDFLWSPIRANSSTWNRNPSVNLEKVRILINLSRQSETTAPPAGGGADTTFTNDTAVAIPDNDPTGASSGISVSDALPFAGVSVAVNIEHTYRGDLTLSLLHDGAAVKVLADQTGGSAPNVVETYTLSGSELGVSDAAGSWALKVVDNAAQDSGTIKSFKLTFHGN